MKNILLIFVIVTLSSSCKEEEIESEQIKQLPPPKTLIDNWVNEYPNKPLPTSEGGELSPHPIKRFFRAAEELRFDSTTLTLTYPDSSIVMNWEERSTLIYGNTGQSTHVYLAITSEYGYLGYDYIIEDIWVGDGDERKMTRYLVFDHDDSSRRIDYKRKE